jgi:hypothetical protein
LCTPGVGSVSFDFVAMLQSVVNLNISGAF